MNMSENSVTLRIAEARSRDVGRGIVRMANKYMRALELEPGDYIEITANKRTVYAQVWPAYSDDDDKDIIRMDGLLRQNLGLSIGDAVKVKKANLKPAQKIMMAPVGEAIRIDSDYLKRAYLLGRAVWKGAAFEVPYYTGALRFMVTQVTPGPAAYVGVDTEVTVREEPVKEAEISVSRVTWEDIGDLEEAKQKIRELVELPLRHPELFKYLGIDPPKGILLVGPPGTGKTLLAKAVATESNAYFASINGPEIMNKYYGESEARLRDIFDEAKKNSPAIIFIDEIDSIAPKREEVTGEVERRVVAQLLTLMDGLQERGQVVVIGATNRPDAVDPALRRPGRFDREITIGMPDKSARKEILQVHTRNVPLCGEDDVKNNVCDKSDLVSLDELAEMTHGYTGADIAALVKEAAMARLRKAIDQKIIDLEQPEIPQGILEKIRISKQDFLDGMKYVQPTVLREIIVEMPEVKWDDIGGYDKVKQELKETVEWPIKYRSYFDELGIDPPRGILLFGPPGTGKTLLAKAVATESGSNFISVRGPEVLSKWFGESEKAIREIFKKARMAAPAVVFFDEIDSIAPARGMSVDTGAMDRIVAQLLAEMDSISRLDDIVIIGATNRPDMMDPALLRPGRFDRIVYIPPPDKEARLAILKVHTRKLKMGSDVDLAKIAEKTEYYTGADIAALVKEAAMLALREAINNKEPHAREVTMKHFEEALTRVQPSLTSEIVKHYEDMAKTLRRALRGS
ncbi:ATPase AAA [Thermocladium modestius]|uniref:ATPase AAA n=1 Tax=Thermocladium modestius TaxID=62609 RepID=A0A830GXX7_9CREN|nr:ATPase AAA [Thermocladium modestius]